ncbi:MAG: putative sugar O-methyltransferase [Actinobacteria bacterium]|nr:putative sugar O-methyltransferase [Actinomycetota bacterium]
MAQWLKDQARALVRRAGYDLVRTARPDPLYVEPSFDAQTELPPGATEKLRPNHPRLLELRERYARCGVPMGQRTMWRPQYLESELTLARFRGDNSYVWQFRNIGDDARFKYFVYLRDLESRDPRNLVTTLGEDGLFGCWTFEYPGHPTVSRDLLDSVNEIYFLNRHTGVLDQPGAVVLDIGAGYGRLAHRLVKAAPGLGTYICVDAVAESTFLCEYYTRFRGVADTVDVVPLDEIDARIIGQPVDIAVNVHSFSEMSTAAIEGWLEVVAATGAHWLLVVPNDNEQLLTFEDDGERKDFSALPARYGYELTANEPIFPDPTVRQITNMNYQFFLYRRTGA